MLCIRGKLLIKGIIAVIAIMIAYPNIAFADSVAQQFQRFGLVGEWAQDCGEPISPQNLHTIYEIISPDEVQTRSLGLPYSTTPIKIETSISNQNQISFSYTVGNDKFGYKKWTVTYVKEGKNLRLFDVSSDKDGQITQNGIIVKTQKPSGTLTRCSGPAQQASPTSSAANSDAVPSVPTPRCRSAQHLKDADANCVAEFYLDGNGFSFPLGSFTLVSDLAAQTTAQNQPGTMTSAGLQNYQVLAKMGLIRISSQQTGGPNQNFNWNNFLAQSQGVQGKVQIEPTPTGRNLQQGNQMVLLFGPAHVTRIVRNEEMKKGADVYTVLLGIHTRDYLAQIKQYAQMKNMNLAPQINSSCFLSLTPLHRITLPGMCNGSWSQWIRRM